MDSFLSQYIQTALWSSGDDNGNFDHCDCDNLAPETLAKFTENCQKFREQAGDLLNEHEDETDAAHDFWLTQNHHGCGFWDGDWPKNGTKLTKIAHSFRECDLYVGDDGLIYC